MPPLYVTHANAKLRLRGGRLLVEVGPPPDPREDPLADPGAACDADPGTRLASLPLGQVSQVILFGNIGLTTPTIDALLSRGVEVVFLTQRGEYRGRLVGEVTPHVPLRQAQYRRLDDPTFRLGLAGDFVHAKLEHQRALLSRHNRERRDPHIAAAIEALSRGLAGVERRTTLASLNGSEGATSAAYFGGLRRLIDPRWQFEDRNRRPPRDPVNVLLSLGYTLLAQAALAAVQTVGLDPYAGFLHEPAYNRPSLALDLMEEFRPVVDGVVLWCLNSGQLTPADFGPGPAARPIILQEAGMKRYLQAFEERLERKFTHPLRDVQLPLRQCMIEQARQVGERLLENRPGYIGMGFR